MRWPGDTRFADDRIVNANDLIAARLGLAGRAVHRAASAADDRRLRTGETRIAGFRRLVDAAGGAAPHMIDDGFRICGLAAKPMEDVERIAERRGVGHRRSRTNYAEIVA